MRWTIPLVAVVAVCGAMTGACAGPGRSATAEQPGAIPVMPRPPGPVTVDVATVAGVGPVLVDGAGYALYTFPPDDRSVVSCTRACAGSWPPLLAGPGATRAGAGVRSALLGSRADPEGGRVVTYAGWPLYTYAADVVPHEARGQALDLNGAAWFVIRASGQVVTTPLAPAPATTTAPGMSGMPGMAGS